MGVAGVLLLIVALKTNFSMGSMLLFVLFVTHALVGAVELGTDGWIQNITGNILTPAQEDPLRLLAADVLAALLRALHREEPEGLADRPAADPPARLPSGLHGQRHRDVCRRDGCARPYAIGKTFFWPTMLAVVGDRFPRTGAIAMSIMGGIGMMSAGLPGRARGWVTRRTGLTAEHLMTTAPAGIYIRAGAEQVPLPRRSHGTRRHEAVGRADGRCENAGAAGRRRRQHRRRP